MKANTHYLVIQILIQANQSILIFYPGYCDFFRLEEDVVTPCLTLTDAQYSGSIREKIMEAHIRATLRDYISIVQLGRETGKFNEEGEVVEWDLIPGVVAPKDFSMLTAPRYKVMVEEEFETDEFGNRKETEHEVHDTKDGN